MNTPVSQVAELTFKDVYAGDGFQMERALTAANASAFATLSDDVSPLRVDSAYAASTEFSGRVVHGLLLTSRFSQLTAMRIPVKDPLFLGQDLVFRKQALTFRYRWPNKGPKNS
jgi:3-hydroxybutyryl-CoA dehydratase